jgi:hypothetical protein
MVRGRLSASLRQLCTTLMAGLPAVSVVVCCLLLWPVITLAAAPELLLEQSHRLRLAEQREWQILLHYQPTRFGTVVSLIDDPAFFLADTGKHDPQAEMEAALAALFRPADPDHPQEHIRCRFPARSGWLIDALAIDRALLPAVTCRELDEALAQVAPQRAVLIFPGNHNNSPASMFGHTLISVEGAHQSRLLSYAVNYAAHTDETNGLAYAVKGIFGFYPGYYSFLPYYVKVREYNDLERRDVWEYQLDLTPAEVERMTLHIWELRNIASEYYFFDENCSYNLLFLLEAARPSLNLTNQSRPWVIPIDTVRTVAAAGLIKEVRYRPSKATRIAALARRMDTTQTELALQLLAGHLPVADLGRLGLDDQAQMRILDIATETTEFRYYRKELDQEAYRQRSLELLKARSLLGLADADYLTLPDPGRPDHGHGSNRLAVGFGVRNDDWYQELHLRPAYHNLLDHDAGYLPGSQIDFANLVLRYTPERNQLKLQGFDLINIVSLSPRHPFFQPVSWKVNTGFAQRAFKGGDQHLLYRLNPGGGFTWGSSQAMVYVMTETEALISGRFRDSFALGAGGSAGVLATPLPEWKLHLSARQLWFELGEPHRSLEVNLQQNWRLGENLSLVLTLGRERIYGHYASEAGLRLNYYW